MTKNVLITGASGFTGRYLTNFLNSKGFKVLAICRKKENFNPGVKVIIHNLLNPIEYTETIDAVVHCAAVSPHTCNSYHNLIRENILLGINTFLPLARLNPEIGIYLSSMAVYGNVEKLIVDESTAGAECDGYGAGKYYVECVLDLLRSKPYKSILTLRLPGIVGSDSHNNFLSTALKNIFSGEPIFLRNPSSYFNNIVHVNTLCNYIADFILSPVEGYSTINIAASTPMQIQEMLEMLAKKVGKKLPKINLREGKPAFMIDNSKMIKVGFKPPSVEEEITKFANDYKGK